jgi:formylglycine-generating enzyme required for sulfatase activity
LIVACLLSATACADETGASRPQWKVFIDTDAPVPAFGSLLFVEVTDDVGAPLGLNSQRLIDVSRSGVWPVSFGVLPSFGTAPRVRARLYRTDQAGARGAPEGSALLDASARLPELGDRPLSVTVSLDMNCFGLPAQLAEHLTCAPHSGELEPEPVLTPEVQTQSESRVNGWLPAASVPCSSTPPEGMVCIPGGAFVLGSLTPESSSPLHASLPAHLVQLSPFFLDAYEVTVGQVRKLIENGALSETLMQPNTIDRFCTYAGDAASSNDLPANCLSWFAARQICGALSKRLPTEAEWEYSAGNLAQKTRFSWGDDPDICAHALVARADWMRAQACLLGSHSVPGPAAGNAPVQAGDVTALGVHNLAGNVAEWVEDRYESYTGPCWQVEAYGLPAREPLRNPVCETGHDGSVRRAVRGGSFGSLPASANTVMRDMLQDDTLSDTLGFRCARSAY